MSALEVLAVIPARGGSKGVPRKNLRTVGGRSLVELAIQAAQESKSITRVVGSSDDADIREEMDRFGARSIERPPHLGLDDTPDVPVFLHTLGVLANEGYEPDLVVNVRPTAPLRTGADIDTAVRALIAAPSARSVKSVSPVGEHPYKMWTVEEGGLLSPLLPSWHASFAGDPDVARQQLPAVYRSNGAVDAVWVSALIETDLFHPGPVVAYLMDADRALDIDSEEDLARAEHLAET